MTWASCGIECLCGAEELGALNVGIDAALDAGVGVPCLNRDEWSAEDDEAIRYAVARCKACPVFEVCRAAAEATQPEFGVWAGVDQGAARETALRIAAVSANSGSWRREAAEREAVAKEAAAARVRAYMAHRQAAGVSALSFELVGAGR